MTPIDPRSSIVAALQTRLSGLQRRAPARGQGRPGSAAATQSAAGAVVRRIATIDRSDPDRRRKAVRVVLEAELARSFGAGLLNDPAFPQMLDAVQEEMQADAKTAAAVRALGDLLLAAPA